jgi:hypothetical protein
VTQRQLHAVAWAITVWRHNHRVLGPAARRSKLQEPNINHCHLAMTRDNVIVNARALLVTCPMSPPVFRHCWPLRPTAMMPSSSPHSFQTDTGLFLNRVNSCAFPFPNSIDDNNPALTTLPFFLFRSLGRPRVVTVMPSYFALTMR